jgi:hypothetical protein
VRERELWGGGGRWVYRVAIEAVVGRQNGGVVAASVVAPRISKVQAGSGGSVNYR